MTPIMTSGKTLYVVTSGEYSDYRIVGIFDDERLALALCNPDADPATTYGPRIETWELNHNADRIRAGLKKFRVALWRDGSVRYVYDDAFDDVTSEASAGSLVWRGERQPDGSYQQRAYFEVSVVARTEDQAIKAANERRAQYLAAGGYWPEDTDV